jgi:hypothetical protein
VADEAIQAPDVEKKYYLFAKLALLSAVINFAGNGVILFALHKKYVFLTRLNLLVFLEAFDGLIFTGILGMCTLCLGLDTLFKYRWPGPTVLAKKRKPQGRDLVLALLALSLLPLNVMMMLL